MVQFWLKSVEMAFERGILRFVEKEENSRPMILDQVFIKALVTGFP